MKYAIKKSGIFVYTTIILLCCLHHYAYFIISDFSGIGDSTYVDLSLRTLSAKIWSKGEIPLINPYNFYGDTIAAKPHTGVFYPLNTSYLIFSPINAKKILTYLHCLILCIGMYLFLTSLNINIYAALLSSLLFSTNPIGFQYATSCFNSHVWFPWIFFIINKLFSGNYHNFYIIALAIILSLSFLAGGIQILIYIVFLAAIYFAIYSIVEKKISFKVIKLILISLLIFLLLCSLQIIISYGEFKYSVRGETNVCKKFQSEKPASWNFQNNINDYFLSQRVKDAVFYFIGGFFFPLYYIGIIILFINKALKINKIILYFIIISIMSSILFIGENPCEIPILKFFRHHQQFFPNLIPFLLAIIAAYSLQNDNEKNIKLLAIISSSLIFVTFIILIKNYSKTLLIIELIFNLLLCNLFYIYKAKKAKGIFMIIFLLAVGYNGIKGYNADKAHYYNNWFSNAIKNNKIIINNKIIEKDAIIYSDAFVFHSPYKRYLNAIFSIKNLQLVTYDALMSFDDESFFNKLLYNQIKLDNFNILGVKYIFFNRESASDVIDKYYISLYPALVHLSTKKIISSCFLPKASYFSILNDKGKIFIVEIKEGSIAKLEEFQKPVVIPCALSQNAFLTPYLIIIEDNKFTFIENKSKRVLASMKIEEKIYDFNVRTFQGNGYFYNFYIDIRGKVNLVKAQLINGELKVIEERELIEGFYKILPLSSKNGIAFLNRKGQIFNYEIRTGKFIHYDNLPAHIMAPFVLDNLAHLDLLKQEIKSSPNWRKKFISDEFEVWEFKGKIYPDLWIVNETRFENFYDKLSEGILPFNKIAYVSSKKNIYKFNGAKVLRIRWEEMSPNRIKIYLNLTDKGILIIRKRWSLCWSSKIDGEGANIFKVNGFMQGVVIPGGQHQVSFECNIKNIIKRLMKDNIGLKGKY